MKTTTPKFTNKITKEIKLDLVSCNCEMCGKHVPLYRYADGLWCKDCIEDDYFGD